MNELEIESFADYFRSKPQEGSFLTGCDIGHHSGPRGKVVRSEIENGICYLICRFSGGAFPTAELSFDIDTLRDGTIRLLSVPKELVQKYADWKEGYQTTLAREKAESLKRLTTVNSKRCMPLLLPERMQKFIAEEVGWNYSPNADTRNQSRYRVAA